jgi:hypothetical protein
LVVIIKLKTPKAPTGRHFLRRYANVGIAAKNNRAKLGGV